MGFFLTVSCTPVLWGRGQEPAEGVLPVHQLPAAEKPRLPLAWLLPHPGAVTTFNSASPQRISGPLVFSGFICLPALRPPSHAFLFTLFLSKTLESKEGRKPAGAGSAQQCHWPWSRAPRSCCLSDATLGVGLCAFLAAPGHQPVDPFPPWPPAGPSSVLVARSVLQPIPV